MNLKFVMLLEAFYDDFGSLIGIGACLADLP